MYDAWSHSGLKSLAKVSSIKSRKSVIEATVSALGEPLTIDWMNLSKASGDLSSEVSRGWMSWLVALEND